MTELLTAAQMRAIEQAAIDSGEVTGLELMERAGQGVVEAIFEEWPELAGASGRGASPSGSPEYLDKEEVPFRAGVLCGPGNNGGDGFVVARLLHERGWAVEVFLYGEAEKLPPDARVNYERWTDLGEVNDVSVCAMNKGWSCDLLIDALFGTGTTRALPDLGELFWNMEDMVDCFQVEPLHEIGRPAIVAIDFPSGVCADSGRDFPHRDEHWRFSASAHITVCFHQPKLGHFIGDAVEKCGKVVNKDIGLRPSHEWRKSNWRQICKLLQAAHQDWLRKLTDQNKFGNGHSVVLTGERGHTGAARLAARGALRVGAGLVTLCVPEDACQEVASQVTSIMMKTVDDAADLSAALEDKRINALCIGPALGLDRAKPLVAAALDAGQQARPTVLDADALSAFADEPNALFAMLHEKCVLTPHGGEFARLFPDISEKLNAVPTKGPAYSKVDATREAAKRAGCVVLFKGADTVIAAPDGRCSINSAHYERSAPWLATAGSGDVLAGFITGLLARGFDPMGAAETAAWLHVECALKFGPGLIAEDIPEQLPAVFRDLGL
ncbi:bifunctional ADP-dependent NAD(P)H-hydrate dehydratase/NAD(P)H-hydrate epimerase [Cognatishimia activa]|uniref:bifunctional ADP-dependent NAD(P)H-hydrate dehydratase/NAD(P)H-hydrate epimerase n=1 Tax=Cognatishimia activa TaxID=1715691 RepID=UPI0006F0DFA0|nr:bifunctional ADP-dependent NAD(P)H-hydrate dehydratase/NAD(P)H-hydrate epimerase [Cognatishimia activa]CUI80630.1 Nicotinamide nucleotide repair protein [Cognatishimia activa]